MKKVYICSPCRGDYENNIQRAKEYSRATAMKGCIPIAPHIYLTQFMDDTIPAERELALSFGRELVLQCDELWAFGLSHPSAGMAGEIEVAKAAGIPVLNGFEEISRVGPAPAAAPDPEPQDAGSVTLHLPGPIGSISVEIDARIVCDLAEQFKAQPGAHFDIGPGGEPID